MARKPTKQPETKKAIQQVAAMFARNGCVRVPDRQRRKKEGKNYHAGFEVRLVASNREELHLATASLTVLGLSPGSPFFKGSRIVLPLYGKDQVEKFRDLVTRAIPASAIAEKIPL